MTKFFVMLFCALATMLACESAQAICVGTECSTQSEAQALCMTEYNANPQWDANAYWKCTVKSHGGTQGAKNSYTDPPHCVANINYWDLGYYGTGEYTYSWCLGGETPTCTAGKASFPTHSWVDGTDCDNGCYVTPEVDICSGEGPCSSQFSWVENGQVCPYNPTDPSKPQKPVPQPNTPQPPQTCNPDGSCTYCDSTGAYCVTSTPQPPAPPAPPAPSTSGACASATCSSSTTSGTGGTPSSGGSTGSGGSGSGGVPVGGSSTSNPASSTSTTCTTGVCDVGNADGSIGGLYQDSTDTPSAEFSSYMTQIKQAPIVSAATGFFTVQAGGSCPSWQIPGNEYWGKDGFSFSFFCSSGMLSLFSIAGWLVLAGGAFCAFRVAIY